MCDGGTSGAVASLSKWRHHFWCRGSATRVVASLPVWQRHYRCSGGTSHATPAYPGSNCTSCATAALPGAALALPVWQHHFPRGGNTSCVAVTLPIAAVAPSIIVLCIGGLSHVAMALPMLWWPFLVTFVIFQCIGSNSHAAAALPMRLWHFPCEGSTFCAATQLSGVVAALHNAMAALFIIFQCIGSTHCAAAAHLVWQQHFPCEGGTSCVVVALPMWRWCFLCGGGFSWFGSGTFCHILIHRRNFPFHGATSGGAVVLSSSSNASAAPTLWMQYFPCSGSLCTVMCCHSTRKCRPLHRKCHRCTGSAVATPEVPPLHG